MSLEKTLGICLASPQIRQKIEQEEIIGSSDLLSQIQPPSLEPTIGNEVFILDTESEGVFRPQQQETVYRTLLKLPFRQRQRKIIDDGFQLNKGFTYLFPLQERVILRQDEYIKASPKAVWEDFF
tara:strand:- start:1182 stop:1556 length:375 start_codon:yes stop_codon:yes gene_type:complete